MHKLVGAGSLGETVQAARHIKFLMRAKQVWEDAASWDIDRHRDNAGDMRQFSDESIIYILAGACLVILQVFMLSFSGLQLVSSPPRSKVKNLLRDHSKCGITTGGKVQF